MTTSGRIAQVAVAVDAAASVVNSFAGATFDDAGSVVND
jgi:hypothetical protein